MKRSDKRIYLFANFGEWGKQQYGGGEVSNRRTLQQLRLAGYDVKVIEKYKMVRNHSLLNLVLLFFKMASDVIRFTCVMAVQRRKDSLVHIVGFYAHTVFFEDCLVSISKALGYKTIYNMCGGGASEYYETWNVMYKKTFRHIVNTADVIFTEGKENSTLIKELCGEKRLFYYPNYVTRDFLPTECPSKPEDRINFVYFGRISPTKNIDIIIETFNLIRQRFDNAYLDIFGNSTDSEYSEHIKEKIHTCQAGRYIKIHQACDHNELKPLISDKHIFLFPTSEPHEGHSNALTEAMAWGIIPIASERGFNRTVIGNENLILKEVAPEAFAAKIIELLESGQIGNYAREMHERVKNNYTEEIVSTMLINEYDSLFEIFSMK